MSDTKPFTYPDVLFNVRFRVGIGIVSVFIVLLLTLVYFKIDGSYEHAFVFLVASLAAAGQIAAAFYSAHFLRLSILTSPSHPNNIKREQIAVTMRFAERWIDPSMLEVRKTMVEVLNQKSTGTLGDAMKEFIKQDIKREQNMRQILNFLEQFAYAIKIAYADEDSARSLFKGNFTNTWDACQIFVQEVRDLRANPSLWIEIETVVKKWRGL